MRADLPFQLQSDYKFFHIQGGEFGIDQIEEIIGPEQGETDHQQKNDLMDFCLGDQPPLGRRGKSEDGDYGDNDQQLY